MTDDVVHRTKPVVDAASGGIEEWVAAVVVVANGLDLEHTMATNGLCEFGGIGVRLRTRSECDSYRLGS